MEIPKALRPHFNKARFLQSLETESLTVAEVRVLPLVIEWKKALAVAKGGGTGTDDEILATIMKVRRDAQRLKGKGTSDADTKEIHEDVAYSRSWDGELGEFVTDNEALADAVSVVHGSSLLLREHIEDYLNSRDVAPKTTDMQRRDLKLFAQTFKFAHNATRPKVLDWVNVELTATQGLSVVTCAPKTPPNLCRVRLTKGRTNEGTIHRRTDHSNYQGTGIW
jgi:hypothetical protein